MAEASDRPPTAEGVAASAPPDDRVRAVPPELLAMPGTDKAEPYRPLSIAALIGLVVAVVYALVVGGGCVVALINRTPWLLPAWTVIFPLLGVLVAWIARNQIQASEGTLSGLPMTKWAIGLCVGFGASYWAYYAATYLSVRQQAAAAAEKWLEQIRQGNLEEAFKQTLRTPRTESGAALREMIEIESNSPPDPRARGGFTGFSQAEYVRFLKGSEAPKPFKLLGIKKWDYEQGGYQVELNYRVNTEEAAFDLLVTVHGVWGKGARERYWYVNVERSGVDAAFHQFTAEGDKLLKRAESSQKFTAAWLTNLARGAADQAYLDTLPPEKRRKEQRTLGALHLAGLPAGKVKLMAGDLVKVDDKTFWSDKEKRDDIIKEVKALLANAEGKGGRLVLPPTVLPIWKRGDSVPRFEHDVQLITPQYLVEGRLAVTADADAANPKNLSWRIEALELVRGRPLPTAPPEGGGRARQAPPRQLGGP
jgi:hypothetical protein